MAYGPGTRVNFTGEQERAFGQQIQKDPRIKAYFLANPHVRSLRGPQLREFGYDVPDNAQFILPTRAGSNIEMAMNQGQFIDHFDDLSVKLVKIGAGAIAGYGAGTIANDLASGGQAAGSLNDAAPDISSPEGYANASAFGANNPVDPGFLPSVGPTGQVNVRPPSGSTPIPSTSPTTGGQAPQTSQSVIDRLKGLMNSPGDWAALAPLIPLLTMGSGGGGNSPFDSDALNDEMTRGLEAQRKRFEQAQPVYDTLVNMAYGMSPTRYRGAAPADYPESAQAAPAGAYQYQSPRF